MSKKIFLKIGGTVFFCAALGALLSYISMPKEITFPKGSDAVIKVLPSCSLSSECVSKDSGVRLFRINGGKLSVNTDNVGKYSYQLKLFDKIPIKTITVSVVPNNYVIPGGEAIGVKMFTEGLLVVHISEVSGADGIEYSPAKEAGIMENDRIMKADGIDMKFNEDFMEYINKKKSSVTLEIARNDELITTSITPVVSKADGKYKVGIWVRDSTAGVGTLTYYNPNNSDFAALGHAICDSDTMSVLTLSRGSITKCSIVSVKKGEKGAPGELKGCITGESIGSIAVNDGFGIYGTLDNSEITGGKQPIETATRFQIKEGPCTILCSVDSRGAREYTAEICKVSKLPEPDNKSMILRVTDEELLNKTGGIVQGMSGSPILQNGRLIGAVTHVFVNDPTKGYAVFIENMLNDNIASDVQGGITPPCTKMHGCLMLAGQLKPEPPCGLNVFYYQDALLRLF